MSTTVPSLNPATPAWKAELNAKLNAHRTRQKPADGSAATSDERETEQGSQGGPATSRAMAARVAARVAERYAKAPSYSEVFAARAIAAAEAAQQAVTAAQHAHEAAQSLLSDVAAGPEIEELVRSAEPGLRGQASSSNSDAPSWEAEPWAAEPWPSEDAVQPDTHWAPIATHVTHPEPLPARRPVPTQWPDDRASSSEPRFTGEVEDCTRQAMVSPAEPVPAKLIEFPRELVAPRKPRPRLAEGPLADEPAQNATLRIFEVEAHREEDAVPEVEAGREAEASREAESVAAPQRKSEPAEAARDFGSSAGVYKAEAAGMQARHQHPTPAEAPDWHSIRLGEHPAPFEGDTAARAAATPLPSRSSAAALPQTNAPLHTAPLEDRLMAAVVDLSLIGMSFLSFVLLFTWAAGHIAATKTTAAGAGAVLIALGTLYLWLFMSYGGATPGMRYAQIALCSFEDDNPSRKAMRARVGATLIALLPGGLGLLWSVFDEDHVGWHDRMTRTYQRSYR